MAMGWNYRILTANEHTGIYEVYYDEDGRKCAHEVEPTILGNNLKEVEGTLIKLLLALDLPAHGLKEKFGAGPPRTAAERLAAFDRVTERLRERLALEALEDGVEWL